MRRNVLVATFTDADALMSAVPAMRRESLRVHDVYAPYPIHGLDRAMGLKRTKLPWVTLLAGLFGLTFAVTFQFYTNVFDWPLNVGGKPDNSSLAFVPICFELTVLIGGLATVLALFVRAKLYPGRRERLPAGGITSNTFALVLRKPNESFDTRRACKILEDCGAHEIEEKEAEL